MTAMSWHSHYQTCRFRRVYRQLETLRCCSPTDIRRALDELPEPLDETYEQTLLGIGKEEQESAHRLFQSPTAAVPPVRVDELAEVLPIRFPQPDMSSRTTKRKALIVRGRKSRPQTPILISV